MLLSSNKDKRTVSTCRNCIGSFCPRSVRTDLRRFARWVFSLEKGSSVNTGTVHVKSYSFCRVEFGRNVVGRFDFRTKRPEFAGYAWLMWLSEFHVQGTS